jgi:hypothetical protein
MHPPTAFIRPDGYGQVRQVVAARRVDQPYRSRPMPMLVPKLAIHDETHWSRRCASEPTITGTTVAAT